MTAVTVGDVGIDVLVDGYARFPASLAYPQAPGPGIERHFGTDGVVRLPIGAFLVRAGDRLVLVDAGGGSLQREDFTCGALLDEMARLGVAPDAVTDVVLTHLHWDHVGWTTRKGVVVFRRATYRCHEADWDHFMCDEGAARKLSPVQNRLETWDAAGPVLPGIDVVPAPGHTPGHTMIVVSSGSERAIILGDAAHCPVELLDLELGGISDVDPGLAARTRSWIARQLERDGTQASAPHFPELAFGRLIRAEGTLRWVT